MAESRRLVDVTEAEKDRLRANLEEQLPGEQYAATRESCVRNLAVTKHAYIHTRIQEKYPGDSEEQIRKRAKAWEKFYELRRIPTEQNISSEGTSSEGTSSKDTSSGDTSSKTTSSKDEAKE
jgi:hypothetical protein